MRNWSQIVEKVYDITKSALRVSLIAGGDDSSRTVIGYNRVDYTTGGGISTSTYTTVTASLASQSNKQNIFHSSGVPILLAINDVDKIIVPPGGIEISDLKIPASASVKIKAIGTAITTGQLCINYYS